ncbi:AraC family transcriptional regulator [Segetibacter koreensis]|uniref:AraC family transcriptional regulator n=1 Tax=Segetibacter koreensis TaxID=398037 RepID=UPI00037A784D|nr:AraC family transcriptional regulator [Segetibacter koreensis]
MKVHFEKLIALPGEPLLVSEVKAKKFSAPLHFHPELELTLILESSGKRFIGDSIENFEAGDLVLVGENLPHFWSNGNNISNNSYSHAIVVQFERYFLGENFFETIGAAHINNLLSNSNRGICIKNPTRELVKEKLIRILSLKTFEKTLLLLAILDIIANSRDCYYLSSSDFKQYSNKEDCTRMNKIYNYVYNNISDPLDIAEIAALLHMSASAFCHYFKKRTQKTFTQFVNEIRIGKAKQLLVETDKSVAEIGYKCGYNSLSNFNKQFCSLTKSSPKSFRKNYTVTY